MVLSEQQRVELGRIAQSRSLPAGYVFRARLILMLADGASYSSIKQRLRATAPTISRWKQRFVAHGLDGLDTAHPGQKPSVLTARLRARILAALAQLPIRARLAFPAIAPDVSRLALVGLTVESLLGNDPYSGALQSTPGNN